MFDADGRPENYIGDFETLLWERRGYVITLQVEGWGYDQVE
jgi:hypothetical protein